MKRILAATLLVAGCAAYGAPQERKVNEPPAGFTALFNGRDLAGWQGLVEFPKRDPDPAKYAAQVKAASEKVLPHWTVIEGGVLRYDGKANSLQTAKDYGDIELWVDWKILPKGDSGIYVRGTPQIQIWDPADRPEGSGGLFNNIAPNPTKPLKCADKPIGQWNTFRILMKGDKVTVWLNGELVVDNTPLDNFWGRPKNPKDPNTPNPPLPSKGPIELQHHGNPLEFRNIFIKEL